jgi:hypothetical protein
MATLGVGTSVTAELRRDPMAADFLVSIASAAVGTKFFVPPLPAEDEPHAVEFFEKLPAITKLTQYATDKDLRADIGQHFFDILRYILFTNRCHLIHLPPELAIPECAAQTEQFLCVVATPERELAFQKKKETAGNAWLWHGSCLDRWHSILHTGLQDLGRTPDARNGGPWFGDGVYQSNLSEYSIAYAGGVYTDAAGGPHLNTNKYANTIFPKTTTVLALCENIKGPELNLVTQAEYTQKDIEGLIVRCLMVVKTSFAWDPFAKPPAHMPSLHECLSYIASRSH